MIFTSSLGTCYFLSASKLACCFFAYTSGYWADVLLLGILDIDAEAYDMGYMNEDYYDGNTDGVGAPEEDYDDYQDYN